VLRDTLDAIDINGCGKPGYIEDDDYTNDTGDERDTEDTEPTETKDHNTRITTLLFVIQFGVVVNIVCLLALVISHRNQKRRSSSDVEVSKRKDGGKRHLCIFLKQGYRVVIKLAPHVKRALATLFPLTSLLKLLLK